MSAFISVKLSENVVHVELSVFGIPHLLNLLLRVHLVFTVLAFTLSCLLFLPDDLVFLQLLGHLFDLQAHVLGRFELSECSVDVRLCIWGKIGLARGGLQSLVHHDFFIVENVVLLNVTVVVTHHDIQRLGTTLGKRLSSWGLIKQFLFGCLKLGIVFLVFNVLFWDSFCCFLLIIFSCWLLIF